MIYLVAIVAVLASLIFGVIFGGYVFSILWAWFVVPVFGIPTLGVAQAIGLLSVVRLAAYQGIDAQEPKRDADEKIIRAVLLPFVLPAVFLLFGWIVKQWL